MDLFGDWRHVDGWAKDGELAVEAINAAGVWYLSGRMFNKCSKTALSAVHSPLRSER